MEEKTPAEMPEDVVLEPENAGPDDTELEELDDRKDAKLKQTKDKLRACEEEKRAHLEDLQRTKADFLNSKKRLEDEKERDRERATVSHIEELLPLCDSFMMAMANKEAWEAAPEEWRAGIEGIYSQLMNILKSYGVSVQDATHEAFDPERHEALGKEPVDDPAENDVVLKTIQTGYYRTVGEITSIIRPARVIVGEHKDKTAN